MITCVVPVDVRAAIAGFRAASGICGPFKTTLTADAMTNKQAVIETASGNIVIDLRPDLALNQVGDLIKHHLVEATCGSTSALICD